jgi:hypothetical protein
LGRRKTPGAGLLGLKLEDAGGAVIGLLQGHLCGVLDILAAARPSTPTAEDPTEKVAQVAELKIAQVELLEAAGAAAPAEPLLAALAPRLLELVSVLPLVAVEVVLAPLVGIGEHLVGGVDLLEPLLGRLIAGVHVGVELAGQPSIGLTDLLVAGAALHPQGGIVVLAGHSHSPPSLL